MSGARRITWSVAGVAIVAAVAGVWWSARWYKPPSPDERFRQALVAIERGDVNAAAAAATALEADPAYASHALLLDAGILLRRGSPAEALLRLARVHPEGEVREPALLLTGEALYHLGRLTEAEGVLRQLVLEHPDHADAHRWLGAIYFDLGANTAAIAALEKVIELDPDDFRPYRLIGLMHHDFEQNESAIEHYVQALQRSPPPRIRQEILHELARTLITERRYAEALERLEQAETDATVGALQAECLWSLGRQDEARGRLHEARALDPGDRVVALLEARIALEEGRPRDAVGPLERVLSQSPHDAHCRYQLALAWRQSGEPQKADEELARWKQSSDLHTRLTELNIQAIERPRDAVVRDQLAEVCLALGKDELAAVWRAAARECRQAQARGSGTSRRSVDP